MKHRYENYLRTLLVGIVAGVCHVHGEQRVRTGPGPYDQEDVSVEILDGVYVLKQRAGIGVIASAPIMPVAT